MGSGYQWLSLVAALFVTTLVVSNIIAVKVVTVGILTFPAAVILFPVSYILGDVLTEVYGYARARRVIWTGFFCNVLAVIAIWLSIGLPASPFWTAGYFTTSEASQQAYEALFGFTPRLLMASFVAYLFGEFLNAFVLARMKVATGGRHLWMRTIGSTLVGQLADSTVFISLAFLGTLPAVLVGQMIATQWILKSGYEALMTPFTYAAVGFLKREEREDHYDVDTNFNPLMWRQ
ncbi:MAG: queuosine precursor transporter [Deltaproteobacteria bacterium]|nr:queuosine precursor transporter [Deltaproteobacteria bacterium]